MAERRFVPKERFINAYYASRRNIIEVSKRFRQRVNLTIVFKDFDDNIVDIFSEVDDPNQILPSLYSKNN